MSPELKDFLAGIATDPDHMSRFTADPEAAMAAAGLSEADQEVLRRTKPADLSDLFPTIVFVCVFPTVSS